MKYFIDTEFIEMPHTIDLISIGIVAEDGHEYYAISNEFDSSRASQWVKDNVIAKLPPESQYRRVSNDIMAIEIKKFCSMDDKPEFWGYYADYDWVVFCWLFGTMMELPKGWPMYCRDVKQLCDSLGNPKLPSLGLLGHSAIHDAREIKFRYEFLTK